MCMYHYMNKEAHLKRIYQLARLAEIVMLVTKSQDEAKTTLIKIKGNIIVWKKIRRIFLQVFFHITTLNKIPGLRAEEPPRNERGISL
ncbi:hypothetical protein GLOIN_2v738109 [Rhizophagus clarus]|uniref:Uncharacterized protein n=1 Tax=Rhizophagus clarus TaxID=94130 RepID=A0A8H3M2M2_9GLOM|nr:hypothetical protein GLOIN_2v738109 [Rhizophagus clarus]